MKRVFIFTTKEEIEALGFIYEPDPSKCEFGYSAKVMYNTFNVNDGIVKHGEPYLIDKDLMAGCIYHRYIHSIYVDLLDQDDQNKLNDWNKNYHGHPRISYSGHTKFTDEENEVRWKEKKI